VSPLTKVFVVLLVVLSMLLAAGTVVFVNARDAQLKTLQDTEVRLKTELANAQSARSEADALRAGAAEQLQSAQNQIEQMRQAANNLQGQLVNSATQLGQAQSQLAMQSADMTRLTEALKASEATKSVLQEQVTELRRTNDERLAQNTQLNQTVSDLTNKLEVTERERQNLAEQLTEAKTQLDKSTAQLRGLGVSPGDAVAAGTRIGPPVSGVIRSTRPIAGVPYATISVGSNDGVARGMEFKVLTREGDFLGILTVDTVEATESTGRLAGPRVREIAQGAIVKTQIGS
jgi:hypothetical protein